MKWIRLLAYCLAGCLVFVLATSVTIKVLLKDDPTIACPDLTNLDIDEAKAIAAQKGLSVLIMKYERKKDIPYNRVVVQKPDPAIPVKMGRTVSVILSDGPKLSEIPSFIGMSVEEAQAALREQQLSLKKLIYVSSEHQGKVLAQAPGSGQNILDEEGVVLIVGGREKHFYLMPDITTADYRTALQEMDRKQIKYELAGPGMDGARKVVLGSTTPAWTIFKEEDVLEIRTTGGGYR